MHMLLDPSSLVQPAPVGWTEALALDNSLVQQLSVATFVVDVEGRVVLWNKACERLTGIAAAEVLGARNQWRAFYGERRPCLADLVVDSRLDEIDALYPNGSRAVSVDLGACAESWCEMPRRGQPRYLAVEAAPIYDSSAKLVGAVQTIYDLTSQKQREIELESLARYDGLTGILNRRSFDDKLAEETRRAARDGRPLALLMIDVDDFKGYNDAYGHQKGDACLVAVAGAISNALSRAGDAAGRYGGDEFVVVLPETGHNGAGRIAERARKRVKELEIAHAGSSIAPCVTLSIGGVSSCGFQGPPSALLASADAALYRAKRDGRNCVSTMRLP